MKTAGNTVPVTDPFVIGQRVAHGAEGIERFSPGLTLVVRLMLQAAVEEADEPVREGAES